MMKAIVYHEFGPPEVLQIGEKEKPVPGDREILVKVKAASVKYGDLIGRNFKNISTKDFNMPGLFLFLARLDFGFSKPRKEILGAEFAGEVEAVGKSVRSYRTGDRVFGYLGQKMGGYAEYITVAENASMKTMPAGVSFEAAACVPYGAIVALNLLQAAKLQNRQNVLIIGASGSIGSAALQLARHHFGAEVTGVCGSNRVEFVKALGASNVVDYTKEDFTRTGESYDLILDVLGRSSFAKCQHILNPGGTYLLASFKTKQLFQMLKTRLFPRKDGKKVLCALSPDSRDNLLFVKKLMEDGKYQSLIDKSFPMEKAAEAHRYAENGLKKGNIVITFNTKP